MDSVYKYLGRELNWTPVKNVGYVLHPYNEQGELAILNIKGLFGSNAEGKCDQGYWILKRSGFLKNNISVMEGNLNKEVAVFKKKGMGGFLEFQSEKTYVVQRNALMTEYNLSVEKQPLINYQHKENRPQVHIQPSAANITELPLLVLFLGYLVIMQRIDANFNMPY